MRRVLVCVICVGVCACTPRISFSPFRFGAYLVAVKLMCMAVVEFGLIRVDALA